MPKTKCTKCGSEEFDEKMYPIYDMWGQFEETKVIKVCRKCGTELPENDERA